MTFTPHEALIERIDKWIHPDSWNDINLYSVLYEKDTGIEPCLENIEYWEVPGLAKPNITDIINRANSHSHHEGKVFGPSWSTKWFRLTMKFSKNKLRHYRERLALKWDSNCEALLYTSKGNPVSAYTGGTWVDRRDLAFLLSSLPEIKNTAVKYYIEMACNGMFGNGGKGLISAPDPKRTFKLESCELVVVNELAHALYWDMLVLRDVAKQLSDNPVGIEAANIATAIINTTDIHSAVSLQNARKRIREHGMFSDVLATSDSFSLTRSSYKLDHTVVAVGHCHIDTAWLWPFSETRRKVVRSWVTQMDKAAHSAIDDLQCNSLQWNFAASQAVQYEWLREDHPNVFARLCKEVKTGKFIPIGGAYTEFDANMPSGESMIRQFLYGIQFFEVSKKENFESGGFSWCPSKVFWLPDTFGYSGNLPQIMQGFEIPYFLSQKLSWNLTVKFHHTTFLWEGIDGSTVLAHFPPADTYNSDCSVAEVLKCVKNHKSLAHSKRSLLLFGHGDGGGGPATSHLEQLQRVQQCKGMPTIETKLTPTEFFADVEEEIGPTPPPPRWVGELYLELHQGTLTSQANIKKQNRQCENRLRTLEALLVYAAYGLSALPAPDATVTNDFLNAIRDEIRTLWKTVLLCQFHDVLPGSSIGQVYSDTNDLLSQVLNKSWLLCQQLMEIVLPAYHSSASTSFILTNIVPSSVLKHIAFNGTGFARDDYYRKKTSDLLNFSIRDAHLMNVSSLERSIPDSVNDSIVASVTDDCVSGDETAYGYSMENKYIKVQISTRGLLFDANDNIGEEAGRGIANCLTVHEDVPFFWDAWDVMPYHAQTGYSLNHNHQSSSPMEEVISNRNRTKPAGVIRQTITLFADSPELCFHSEVSFPLALHTRNAIYEIQNGLMQRPTHGNTQFDNSMYEVCAQRFACLAEPDYGVALLNDCKYGHSCRASTLSLSLLRSPKSPDNFCDMGKHEFTYVLLPYIGASVSGIVGNTETQRHSPVQAATLVEKIPYTALEGPSLAKIISDGVSSSGCSLAIDCIKLAEDDQDVIIRLVETSGCSGTGFVCMHPGMHVAGAREVNMAEKELPGDRTMCATLVDGLIQVRYTPFKIITVRITLHVQ
eukprot:GSChrysophyteH1.ASY1.ANO1.2717.1 assembled CDS